MLSRHYRHILFAALGIAGFFAFSGCIEPETEKDSEPAQQITESQSGVEQLPLAVRIYFRPLPDKMPGSENDTPEMASLGKKLFFERGVSLTKTQACNDCHFVDERRAGVDYKPTSLGAKGMAGTRNSPTVYNAGFQAKQFWDGRAADLVEQAKGPLLNPIEMAMRSEEDVVNHLKGTAQFHRDFRCAFPEQQEPITFDNVARAIAAYERTLIAPARFDDYLRGQADALTADEKAGLHRFMDTGCIECHNSTPVGGRLMKKLGVYNPYENQSDVGRFEITKQPDDRFVFKVAMLRNVTLTAPYFHDGQISTLAEAIRRMAWLQLNVQLTPAEINEIKTFLGTLQSENLTGTDALIQ